MHMLSHTHSTSITSTALIVNVLLVGDKLQMATSHNPPTWGCMSWETNIERARTAKELKGRRGEAELVEKTRRVGLGGGVVRRNQSVPVWKGEEGRGKKVMLPLYQVPACSTYLPPSLYIPLLSKHLPTPAAVACTTHFFGSLYFSPVAIKHSHTLAHFLACAMLSVIIPGSKMSCKFMSVLHRC